MLRAMIVLAVALATASSVWAQTPDSPRRPVPFDRKPVERTGHRWVVVEPERPGRPAGRASGDPVELEGQEPAA